MGQDSYSEIGGPNGKLAKLLPFDANTIYAEGDVDERRGYRVTSYGTEIARVVRPQDGGMIAYVTEPGFYSQTTSRQQNLCRAWLPGKQVEVDPVAPGDSLDCRIEDLND